MSTHDLLHDLRSHPIFCIAERLARFMRIKSSLVPLIEFLSLCAGKKGTPININLVTDQEAVDQNIADRILSIDGDAVARIDTYSQFRAAEKKGFEGLAVMLVRRSNNHLYRDVVECLARSVDSSRFLPSVWRIVPQDTTPFLVAPTLRLVGTQIPRKLHEFAHAFAVTPGREEDRELLFGFLNSLGRNSYPCDFWQRFTVTTDATAEQPKSILDPLSLLILERLLHVVANLRRLICESRPTEPAITIQDYQAVRSLLISLPLMPIDRHLSAQAVVTAKCVYKAVQSPDHQLSLPDRSAEGHHWFTRRDVVAWTGLGYNTAKKHLQELENDDIVVSTLAENNRDHGRQIHFRFADNRVPPFRWRNPFDELPNLASIPA